MTYNNDGTYSWTVKVNQAADKDKHEGISYGVEVNYDPEYSPGGYVSCIVTIKYYVYSNEAWVLGCGG
jgi:hypothetical protein